MAIHQTNVTVEFRDKPSGEVAAIAHKLISDFEVIDSIEIRLKPSVTIDSEIQSRYIFTRDPD